MEVYTDHLNLTYFTTTKVLNLWQARWSEKLGGYNFWIIYQPGRTNSKADLLLRREDYVAEGRKEYKKLRPSLLPAGKWVRLFEESSGAAPKKTTPGKVSKVPKNHQDKGPPGGPDSSAAIKARKKRPKKAANMPSAAATTQGQLRALGEDEKVPEGVTSYKQSPRSQALGGEGTNNPTTKATLDKDTAGQEMTD